MVILDMNLEVPGEVVDTLTQQGDLHFRRASIRLMNPELLDDCLPVRLSNSHVFSALYLSFFLFVAKIFTIPTRPCKGALKANDAGSGHTLQRFLISCEPPLESHVPPAEPEA